MNRNHNYSGVSSVVGLIVVLGMARGVDAFMAFLQQRNAQTFSLNSFILWSYALITLFTAAFLLLLFWFVLNRAARNVWIAMIYLLTGLLIVVYPAIYLTPALRCWFPQFDASVLPPSSFMFFSGGFIAIVGLFMLILNYVRNVRY